LKKEVLTNFDLLQKGDLVLLLGTPLFFNDHLQNVLVHSEVETIYMHPIDYKNSALHVSQYIKYEVGSEEGICALLLYFFAHNAGSNIQDFIADLDIGYLSAETSVGEEELEEVLEKSKEANTIYLVLSTDLLGHKNAANIIKILGALNLYSPLNLIIQEGCSKSVTKINVYNNESLEEIEELDSFDGLVICKSEAIEQNTLLGGNSFSKIAKINEGDNVAIKFDEEVIQRVFKIDSNLQGTIALCSIEGIKSLPYSYKQVKIEKVD
jgi:NADH-quinone oxidoreductase subunit F